jgi:hypothetical protein
MELSELREYPQVLTTKFVKWFTNGQANYLGIVKMLKIYGQSATKHFTKGNEGSTTR